MVLGYIDSTLAVYHSEWFLLQTEPFQKPVSLEQHPDYAEYIFHPMDLCTLEKVSGQAFCVTSVQVLMLKSIEEMYCLIMQNLININILFKV